MSDVVNSGYLKSFLDIVLSWLKQEATNAARSALHDFLKEHLPEWKQFVKDTVRQGLEWGLKKLETLKAKIVKLCTQTKVAISGLIIGMALGGPPGAVIGALTGLSLSYSIK